MKKSPWKDFHLPGALKKRREGAIDQSASVGDLPKSVRSSLASFSLGESPGSFVSFCLPRGPRMLSPLSRIPCAPSSKRSLKAIPIALEGKKRHHSVTSVFDVTIVLPLFIAVQHEAEEVFHLFGGVR